jgi:hypothetical protein
VASTDASQARERFGLALDLFDLAERMLRQRLRRKHPEATDADVDVMIGGWLEHRPGAEHGDGEGTPVSWPRRPA